MDKDIEYVPFDDVYCWRDVYCFPTEEEALEFKKWANNMSTFSTIFALLCISPILLGIFLAALV